VSTSSLSTTGRFNQCLLISRINALKTQVLYLLTYVLTCSGYDISGIEQNLVETDNVGYS